MDNPFNKSILRALAKLDAKLDLIAADVKFIKASLAGATPEQLDKLKAQIDAADQILKDQAQTDAGPNIATTDPEVNTFKEI